MATRIEENRDDSRYEVYVDDQLAGFTEYKLDGPRIALLHTEIDDAFEGQGLGKILAESILDAAREAGLAVLPYCPFIASYIKRTTEYLDLVPEDQRGEFDLA